MKFSDIERARWEDIKSYMDTCLLPMTGLTGEEEPWKATEALENLRDAMDAIEKRYVGRIVTYPALHYTVGHDLMEQVSRVCERLRRTGFRYVILITVDPILSSLSFGSADLFLTIQHVKNASSVEMVSQLWHGETDIEPYA